MECIIAKIFGSEAQKEAAIELFMKTHGGRSFLHGHLFGDNVHEFLAPCIYEGEGEMLGMAFFKSLVKQHGTKLLRTDRQGAGRGRHQKAEPAEPGARLGAERAAVAVRQVVHGGSSCTRQPSPICRRMPPALQAHAEFAADWLQARAAGNQRHDAQAPVGLADRQCRMAELSQRVQDAVIILCTSLYAARQQDEVVRTAADVICQDLTRQFDGRRPSATATYRTVTQLGQPIVEGGFKSIAGIRPARS